MKKNSLISLIKIMLIAFMLTPNALITFTTAEAEVKQDSNEKDPTQPDTNTISSSLIHSEYSMSTESKDKGTSQSHINDTEKINETSSFEKNAHMDEQQNELNGVSQTARQNLEKKDNQIKLSHNLTFDKGTNTLTVHGGMFTQTINMDVSLVQKIVLEEGTSFPNDSSYLFANYTNLLTIEGLSHVDTSNVINMNSMFAWDSLLVDLDVTNFNTSNVTDMSFMFTGLRSLPSLDLTNFTTLNVTNMSGMFSWMTSLTSLDLSNFNTQNVSDMSAMFAGSNNLINLNINNFKTSHVTNMSYMFEQVSSLTHLDISSFDTTNVTLMGSMFRHTDNLIQLELSNFNTANVTDMSYMFAWSNALTDITLSSFDTSNVTDMSYMFAGLRHLTSLNLGNFDTSNVIDMSFMFNDSVMLKELTLGSQFKFVSISYDNITFYDAKLTQPIMNDEYTGKWINVGTGNATDPSTLNTWSADEFMKNYDGTKDADTYIWEKQAGEPVTVKYVDIDGKELTTSELLQGKLGEIYVTEPKQIFGYALYIEPENASGQYTTSPQTVVYVYNKVKGKDIEENNQPNTGSSSNNTNNVVTDKNTESLTDKKTFNTSDKSRNSQDIKNTLTHNKKQLPKTGANYFENIALMFLGILFFSSSLLIYHWKYQKNS